MLLENTVISPTSSLFAQPDDGSARTVTEAQFELPEILQATIEQAINSVANPEIVMSTQDVLDTFQELYTQRFVGTEQIDTMLKANIRIHHFFQKLLSNDF